MDGRFVTCIHCGKQVLIDHDDDSCYFCRKPALKKVDIMTNKNAENLQSEAEKPKRKYTRRKKSEDKPAAESPEYLRGWRDCAREFLAAGR